MSAAGNAIGTAIVAYEKTALAAFVAARKPGPYSAAELVQLQLIRNQADGNAIVDNLPSSQGSSGASNWDGGQANTNYGGMPSINGGNV